MATKRELTLTNIHSGETLEFLSGNIKLANQKSVVVELANQKSVVVGAYYIPPKRVDRIYLDKTLDEIRDLSNMHKNSIFIIGGDFNLPDIDWIDLSITGTQYPARRNETFLSLIADNNLEQKVDSPTRKDNILDLVPQFITDSDKGANPHHIKTSMPKTIYLEEKYICGRRVM